MLTHAEMRSYFKERLTNLTMMGLFWLASLAEEAEPDEAEPDEAEELVALPRR